MIRYFMQTFMVVAALIALGFKSYWLANISDYFIIYNFIFWISLSLSAIKYLNDRAEREYLKARMDFVICDRMIKMKRGINK